MTDIFQDGSIWPQAAIALLAVVLLWFLVRRFLGRGTALQRALDE